MKKIWPFALVVALIFGCKKPVEKQSGEIEKAAWLVGNWEQQTAQGTLYENWAVANDSVYEGRAFFIKAKDTLFSESVALTQSGKSVLYTVTVKGQNGELPVAFKMTSATPNTLVFENPSHDFPNKITYKMISKDSLVAQISGLQNGKAAGETYAMHRSK